MKTTKKVIADNAAFKPLINAVINGLPGMNRIPEINRHGIDGGYGNFIYYSDTCKFAHKHRLLINKLLEHDSVNFGEEVVSMVSGFGVFRNNPMDAQDKKDLYRYLSGVKCKETTIPNLMAWYAAEIVCRWFED